ncbi:MAG: Flp pilus assembly protein CpaB, partial [Bdellovibrionota bacterium]
MNNRVLTLSLVMALIAVYFVYSFVTGIEEEAKKKFGTEVLVVTAKKDIKEMDTIKETLLELKEVPKRYIEPAAVT